MNKNKLQLHIGFMSSKEIADWLQISQGTYSQAIERYLDRLTPYCTFTRAYGGIDISEIVCSTYLGRIKTEDIASFKRYVREQKSIQHQYYPLLSKEKVAKDLARMDKTLTEEEALLKASLLLKQCGTGRKIWSIYDKETNQHSFMTPEEDALFTECIQEGVQLNIDEILDDLLLIVPEDGEEKEFYSAKEKRKRKELNADFAKKRVDTGIAIFKEKTGKDILLCQCFELTP